MSGLTDIPSLTIAQIVSRLNSDNVASHGVTGLTNELLLSALVTYAEEVDPLYYRRLFLTVNKDMTKSERKGSGVPKLVKYMEDISKVTKEPIKSLQGYKKDNVVKCLETIFAFKNDEDKKMMFTAILCSTLVKLYDCRFYIGKVNSQARKNTLGEKLVNLYQYAKNRDSALWSQKLNLPQERLQVFRNAGDENVKDRQYVESDGEDPPAVIIQENSKNPITRELELKCFMPLEQKLAEKKKEKSLQVKLLEDMKKAVKEKELVINNLMQEQTSLEQQIIEKKVNESVAQRAREEAAKYDEEPLQVCANAFEVYSSIVGYCSSNKLKISTFVKSLKLGLPNINPTNIEKHTGEIDKALIDDGHEIEQDEENKTEGDVENLIAPESENSLNTCSGQINEGGKQANGTLVLSVGQNGNGNENNTESVQGYSPPGQTNSEIIYVPTVQSTTNPTETPGFSGNIMQQAQVAAVAGFLTQDSPAKKILETYDKNKGKRPKKNKHKDRSHKKQKRDKTLEDVDLSNSE